MRNLNVLHLLYHLSLLRMFVPTMVISFVTFYFILVVAIVGLICMPERRLHCFKLLRRLTAQTRQRIRSFAPAAGLEAVVFCPRRFRFPIHFCWQLHGKYLAAALFVLLVPVLAAIVFRSQIQLEGYSDYEENNDPVIVALLEGEQLVPPAPVPPEVFATVEVQAERPLITSANRDWQLLEANFRQRLLHVYKIMEEQHGYSMVLLEGYRTPERQNKLAALGPHVTRARAYQSYHQHGRAADLAFMRDGKIVISEKNPWALKAYKQFGEVAESVGLTWGGRWKLMDFGHVELRRG